MGTTAGQPGAGAPQPGTNPNGQGAAADPSSSTQQGQPGGGTGGSGQPPAQSGQGGVGGGASGAGDFDRGQLDPVLRDMNPQQINEFFTALVTRLPQGQGGGNGGNGNNQPRPDATPEPNYKELFDPNHENFNPQEGLRSLVEKQYGPLISDINKRSVRGLYSNFRSQLRDFGEYEGDIDKALAERDATQLSEKDVFGTYLAIKGMRQLQKDRQTWGQGSGSSTHPPSAPVDTGAQDEPLDDLEKEYARQMFGSLSPVEAETKYKEFKKKANSDQGPFEVKVPTGNASPNTPARTS